MMKRNLPPKTREQIMKDRRDEAIIRKIFNIIEFLGGVLFLFAWLLGLGIAGSSDIGRPCGIEPYIYFVLLSILCLVFISIRKVVSFLIDVRHEFCLLLIFIAIFSLILIIF